MLRVPPNADPYLRELVATLNAELLRKEPLLIGSHADTPQRSVASMLAIPNVWMPPSVVPDGSLDAGDLRTIAWSYYGGVSWSVRFRAPLTVGWVQVHVQSGVAGEGGVAAYDPVNFKSSTQIDCRQNRLQDVSVTPLSAGAQYLMFLVPVQYDAADTKVLYDGEGGRPDQMAFVGVTG